MWVSVKKKTTKIYGFTSREEVRETHYYHVDNVKVSGKYVIISHLISVGREAVRTKTIVEVDKDDVINVYE